jgi:hypothetical protein
LGFGLLKVGPKSDLAVAKDDDGVQPGTATAGHSLLAMCSQEETMENSVHQARWLLAPVFAVSITFLAIGIIVS